MRACVCVCARARVRACACVQSGSETHLKEWEAQRALLLNDLQLSRQVSVRPLRAHPYS